MNVRSKKLASGFPELPEAADVEAKKLFIKNFWWLEKSSDQIFT